MSSTPQSIDFKAVQKQKQKLRQPNHKNSFWLYKMCELQACYLSKIDQETIGAAMERVTRYGSTRLGPGRAIGSNKRGPFSNFLPSVIQVFW